ncbi:hypothetical protein BDZ89DRAFT_1130984 [Hymenopellis radicata]|nr:hypothetical protein BDZ89DRAFT_1130984 [Hymenopellis radicata]
MTGYSRPPRRFNIPRQKPSEENGDDSDPGIIRGAALKNHFPVYQPPTPRLLPAEEPLEVHFNPKTANRQMGAGHYHFDPAGQARLDKQKELKKAMRKRSECDRSWALRAGGLKGWSRRLPSTLTR